MNGMSFRVSTKRVYSPDGSPFEGFGVEPNIEIISAPEDMLAGRDPLLERPLEEAAAASGS